MKIFVALFVVCGAIVVAQALSREERNVMASQIAGSCKDKEGGTDADLATIMAREAPTTKAAKCMVACFFETVGIIKDNKPSHEGGIEVTKKIYPGDDKAMAVTMQVGADCGDVSDPDRCELGLKLGKCTHESLVKQGIDPKFY